MSEENAYDKFLQNYIMYGMSDPNGLYSQYAQEHGGGGGDGQQNSGYDDKSGSQQRGGYQHNTNNYSSNNTSRNSGYNNRNAKPEVNPDGTITQRDTIFIQNLPKSVTVSELEQAFGSIGIIKIDKKTNSSKIWIYKDKNTGEGKGEATVTYDDEEAANAAINWFNNKEILGNVVKIQLATRKNNLGNFNKGGNRGGYGGGGGYGNRGDDRGGRGGGGGGGYGNRGDDRGGRGGGSGGYGNRGDDRGGRGGGGGGYSGGQGGYGGGNRFNDRNNDRNNDSNYNDRNDRNQNRGGGGGGYHNRSNNNYSRPAPY